MLTLKDFSRDELGYLVWVAADLKERLKSWGEVGHTVEFPERNRRTDHVTVFWLPF